MTDINDRHFKERPDAWITRENPRDIEPECDDMFVKLILVSNTPESLKKLTNEVEKMIGDGA